MAKEYEKDFGEEFDVDELAKEYEKDFGEEFDVDELIKEYEKDFEELQEYENVDSQSTVQVHGTSEMQEESQEYDEDQLENDEEIELDLEEYEQNQDPIHDPDEIEFIRDVEELARIMREYTEASGGSEEDIKECDNAGFKAEQTYNESREMEQNQEEKEAYQEVEEKEKELTKEENLEQTREDLSIQEQNEDFEEIEEEFTEIEQEEFEYLWEKYAEYDQEGRNAEGIAELMHEAEEAYEVLKQAEEAYNQQEKENLKSINQEEEEDLEEYKKEIETEEGLEYLVEAEEKLYAEGKSSQEIAKEMQKVENVYEIKEVVEKIYEQQEKDKLKLVDHEDEEDLEDEPDEIDRRDAIEFLIETEEELHQREKSQEEIDEQMEKIANDYFQNEQEKNQQIEQEKEIIKEIKNVPKEIDEKNSEIEEQKRVEQALTHYDERDIEVNLDAEEEVLEEIESDLKNDVKSDSLQDSSQEMINESLKESEDEELEEDEYEKLKQLYRQETGRNPMYAKKETKGFRKWLVEQEFKTKEMEEKEEEEKWKTTLKMWIEESREDVINSKLKQILKEILQNFSNYEEFEESLRRYKNAKLTEKEREKLNSIIVKILNKNPIHLQLYYNLSGFKAYFQKQHWWNPWLVKEIKYKFLNHLSKKYERLKQNLKILFELSKQNTQNENRKVNLKNGDLSGVNNDMGVSLFGSGAVSFLYQFGRARSVSEEKFLRLMHSPASRKQLKLIVNNKIFAQMKDVINEKVKEFAETGKKIPISEISKNIEYKDRTRISNTIKTLIGNKIYDLVFGGHKPAYEALTMEQIDKLVKEIGVSKNGIEGLITERGLQMLKDAQAGNIPLSQVRFEIWCQVKEHKPFGAWWSNLKRNKYCKRCDADSRAFSYFDAIKRGLENGFYLKETQETIRQKILKERGRKVPSDVALDWVCEHGHLTSKSYVNIHKKGCKQCYYESRSITYSQAQDVASLKGYTLDMTPAQFERAIDKGRKKDVKPSLVKLKWSCGKHTWWTSFQTMKGTGTCPTCSAGYYESRTRRMFKKVFSIMKFPQTKIREVIPNVNIYKLMHFDGYCEFIYAGKRVKVAFEFQGYQHYKFPNVFHRSYREFLNLKKNDAKKMMLAKDNDIILIVVPYTLYKLDNTNQRGQDHIISEFKRQFCEIFGLKKAQFKFDPTAIDNTGFDRFLGT